MTDTDRKVRWTDEHPQMPGKFRWDPTVNMGHIITVVTSFISTLVIVMVAYNAIDKRIAILEGTRVVEADKARERADSIKEKIDDLKESVRDTRTTIESMRTEMRLNNQPKKP